MKKIFFLLTYICLATCFSGSLKAQKQLNHWWFGSSIDMHWDCAGNYTVNKTTNPTRAVGNNFTISDEKTGNLLFHVTPTDFRLSNADGGIYDNTSTYMQLSSGGPAEINLNSANGYVIGFPVSDNIWYAFYSYNKGGNVYDLHHSVIDMSLPGNGSAASPSGEVISHLNYMITDMRISISAVRHANGSDYWLIVQRANNSLEAYQVSLAGGIGAPVISNIGVTGRVKFSVSGAKAVTGKSVLDFDIATGQFSNEIIIANKHASGGVFSPNCKYLYIGGTMGNPRWRQTVRQGFIARYDMSTLSAASIPDTIAKSGVQSLNNWAPNWTGVGRLHYDGNIYFKNGAYGNLSILHNPNSATPTVSINAEPFPGPRLSAGTWGSGGLPRMVSSWAVEVTAESLSSSLDFTNKCDTATYNFDAESCGMVTSYHWDFGDGGTAIGKTASHTYTTGGKYIIELVVVNDSTCSIWNTDTIYDTLNVDLSNCTLPVAAYTATDTAICVEECITFTDSSSSAATWEWTFNGGSPNVVTSQGSHDVCFSVPGVYDIRLIVTNKSGVDTAKSIVEVFEKPELSLGDDIEVCEDSAKIIIVDSYVSYLWDNGDTTNCLLVTNSGLYSVEVSDSNGCVVEDEINVLLECPYTMWVPSLYPK